MYRRTFQLFFPLLVQSFCFITFMYVFHPRAYIPSPAFICLFISLSSRLSLFLPSSTRHFFFQSLFNRSVLLFLSFFFFMSLFIFYRPPSPVHVSCFHRVSLHPSSFPSSPLPVYPPFTAPIRPASFQCTPLFHPSLSLRPPFHLAHAHLYLSIHLPFHPSLPPSTILLSFPCTSLLVYPPPFYPSMPSSSIHCPLHVHHYLSIPLLCIPLCLPVLHSSCSYPSPFYHSPPLSVPHPMHIFTRLPISLSSLTVSLSSILPVQTLHRRDLSH